MKLLLAADGSVRQFSSTSLRPLICSQTLRLSIYLPISAVHPAALAYGRCQRSGVYGICDGSLDLWTRWCTQLNWSKPPADQLPRHEMSALNSFQEATVIAGHVGVLT